ncbi:hypothetical protein C8R45DRAFT_414468 [Mycena sanguinolenta]|nr:hypothetical protein C8R45DRAFT_414468 [Mycena sanguinolenta]
MAVSVLSTLLRLHSRSAVVNARGDPRLGAKRMRGSKSKHFHKVELSTFRPPHSSARQVPGDERDATSAVQASSRFSPSFSSNHILLAFIQMSSLPPPTYAEAIALPPLYSEQPGNLCNQEPAMSLLPPTHSEALPPYSEVDQPTAPSLPNLALMVLSTTAPNIPELPSRLMRTVRDVFRVCRRLLQGSRVDNEPESFELVPL